VLNAEWFATTKQAQIVINSSLGLSENPSLQLIMIVE
jgi:hypothetical protein